MVFETFAVVGVAVLMSYLIAVFRSDPPSVPPAIRMVVALKNTVMCRARAAVTVPVVIAVVPANPSATGS